MQAFYFAICLTLLALAAGDHHEHGEHEYTVKTHEDLLKYRTTCVDEGHISNELVEKYKKWDFPDDEKTRCYMKCIFEQFGLFDEKNGFNVYKIHHQLEGKDAVPTTHIDHNNDTHKKIESCADNNSEGSDACTWAYRGGMCFIRNNLRLVKQSVKA